MQPPSDHAKRQRRRGEPSSSTSLDIQVLVLVDLHSSVSLEELRQSLPTNRGERFILKLTDFGVSRVASNVPPSPAEWPPIGAAVEALVRRIYTLCEGAFHRVKFFVGGQAPSPVFVHLGYLFSLLRGKVFLSKPLWGGGNWEPFSLDVATESELPPDALDQPFFDLIAGLPPAPVVSSGRTALCVETTGRYVPDDLFADFFAEEAEHTAGVVKLGTSQAMLVDQPNISGLTVELQRVCSTLAQRFPRQNGLALFFEGPGDVAFALGVALHCAMPKINVWLTQYRRPTHERVYSLPIPSPARVHLPDSAQDELDREKTFQTMVAAIAELQQKLETKNLPADTLNESERSALLARLRTLTTIRKADQVASCRLQHEQWPLNDALLQAFCALPVRVQQHQTQWLVLRELFGEMRQMRSGLPQETESKGIVLEQFELSLDTFALRVLINLALGSTKHPVDVRRVVEESISALLHGMEAMDRLEHGERITRLAEQRLRAYLGWHLQLARAQTVRKPAHVNQLLSAPIFVELAPLVSRNDLAQHEQVVLRGLETTEFFCAILGQLVRKTRRPGFDPSALVDAVRTYSRAAIQSAMTALVTEHDETLVPWKD